MGDIAATAQRLREVKQACRKFLTLWALDRMCQAGALDRMAQDIEQRAQRALSDPHNHDWSLLYRGSVLDD